MKRAVLVLMAVLLLASICWAQDVPKGKDVTITGVISCTFCNLPAVGKCSKECCQGCIKSGDPVLLTDAKGSLYILLSGEKMKPLMTADKLDLLQEKVSITGILVQRGGLQGIYVKKMEKAK